jgi:hypothetical protein
LGESCEDNFCPSGNIAPRIDANSLSRPIVMTNKFIRNALPTGIGLYIEAVVFSEARTPDWLVAPESVFPQVHTFPSSLAAYILSKPAHYLTS